MLKKFIKLYKYIISQIYYYKNDNIIIKLHGIEGIDNTCKNGVNIEMVKIQKYI